MSVHRECGLAWCGRGFLKGAWSPLVWEGLKEGASGCMNQSCIKIHNEATARGSNDEEKHNTSVVHLGRGTPEGLGDPEGGPAEGLMNRVKTPRSAGYSVSLPSMGRAGATVQGGGPGGPQGGGPLVGEH